MKIGALLMLLAMSFLFLGGCGDKKAPVSGANGATGGTSAGDANDTLAKIKKAGVIKWGADASGGAPFVFENDKNAVIGFEIDIMEKLAACMGVKQERVQLDWDGLIDDLRSKRTDMVMNGIEINEERKKAVSFSAPYCAYEQQLTVRAADKDTYKSLDDLKGKNIATLKSAEANNVLKRAGFTDDQIHPQADSSLPYTELENKRVDAVLQESCIAAYYADPAKKPALFNVPKTFSPGNYAVAVRLEDASLLKEIDRCIDVMKKNGELAAIYKKWNMWTPAQTALGIQEAK